MKRIPFISMVFSGLLFFVGAAQAFAETTLATTVELPSLLHFLTPGGDDIEVPPGEYQVEAAESWLKLVPEGLERTEAVLVDATQGTHEETLTESGVRLEGEPENPDVFHLAMLLSDGTGLEAIGTKSGIRSRGLNLAFVSKLSKARTFTARPKILVPGSIGQAQPAVPLKKVSKTPLLRVLGIPKACDSEKIEKVRARASSNWDFEKIDCQLTLDKGWIITKKLIFEGAKANRVTLDCQKATLGDGADKDMIEVRSRKYKDKPKDDLNYEKEPWKWERPQNVTIKNCNIIGSVRVWGMATNGEGNPKEYLDKEICIPMTVPQRCQKLEKPNSNELKKSSRTPGHAGRVQANAPKNIVFDNVTITGVGRNPFYLSPGVTYTTLINSTMNGKSDKVAIYLDAESAYNTIKNNSINVVTAKDKWEKVPGMTSRGWPLIAIDGSAGNKIMNNKFSSLNHGGIYLYRNCGEGGIIRHTTPSHNEIINNIFYYNKYNGSKPAIYFGSRDYGRLQRLGHCNDDDGKPFGSSASEKDYARHNVVMHNQFYKRKILVQSGQPFPTVREAQISDLVKTKNPKVNAPNFIEHNQMVTPQTVVEKRRAGCYLPDASPNFLLDGRSLDTLKDSGNKACLTQSSCTDGELSRSNASDCRVNKVDFSCQVSGNNKGCQKVVACPSGKKIVGAKAACNLEFGTVSSNALRPILINLIKVIKASDKVSAGSCHVGGNKLQSGQKEITINKSSPSVAIGCKEHDENGGDCHIKGTLYCR